MNEWLASLFFSSIRFSMTKSVSLSADDHIGAAQKYAIGLGLCNRSVQIALTCFIIGYIFRERKYELKEEIMGTTQSYIGAGGLYKHLAYKNAQHCTNTTRFWYHNTACDGDDKLASYSSSCEYDITCNYPDYAEATKKTSEAELQVFTYLKDTRYEVFPCSVDDASARQCAADEQLWKMEGVPQCKCWKTSNMFLLGIEQMTLTLRHRFAPLRQLSAELSEEERSWLAMPSYIVKDKVAGAVIHEFAAGTSITGTVQQWLEWAGVTSLDDVNHGAFVDYPPSVSIPGSDNRPVFRLTGIEIRLDIHYEGSVGLQLFDKKALKCFIIISVVDGWHSFGSDVVYVKYSDSEGNQVVHGRYTRGISFKLSSSGQIGEFSLTNLFIAISVMIVYFKIAPQVAEFTFHMFGMASSKLGGFCKRDGSKRSFAEFMFYESTVWRQEACERVTLDGHHAKRLLQTLLVRMLFQARNIQDRLTYHDAVKIFTELMTTSRTAAVQNHEVDATHEQDRPKSRVKKLHAKDVEQLMAWLFKAAHPELRHTPVEDRAISVNRFATLLGGDQHPTLEDCLTHANLDSEFLNIPSTWATTMSNLSNHSFPLPQNGEKKHQPVHESESLEGSVPGQITEVKPRGSADGP